MSDTQALRRYALEEVGVDLMGVAPIKRFGGLEPEADPGFIKPDARSVIVLGFQVPRGALRGIEQGTAWSTLAASTPLHPQIIVEMTYLVCRRLETDGWEAVPVFHHPTQLRKQGVRVSAGKPEPDVILDMDYAAHAAGLGSVGIGKFFLTPEFGPRQVFSAILTDAGLDPDDVRRDAVCDNCGECLAACPYDALSREHTVETQLCGTAVERFGLHLSTCLGCDTGAIRNPYCTDAEPWRIGAACGRACVAHLEEAGRLTRQFKAPFREPAEGRD